MRILLTGGTGLIGRALCRALTSEGHSLVVLSRHPETVRSLCGHNTTPWATLDEWTPDIHIDAVINLAGEPIADRRWTRQQKQRLLDSRVLLTHQLVARMAEAQTPPSVLISGSAIGIYGNCDEPQTVESQSAALDFAAQLCEQWEAAALHAQSLGIRTVILRTGLVLDVDGGLLKKMRLPFRMGLGAQLGTGTQWMSWIHIDDYVEIVLRLLKSEDAAGAYNLTAPFPVTHQNFCMELARALHRPCWFAAPARPLQWLLGERSILLLGGQHVVPSRVLESGYSFRYPRLPDALIDLVSEPAASR